MQKFTAICLLLVLCTAQVSQVYASRDLLAPASASGGSSASSSGGSSVSAGVSVTSTGGQASGSAVATGKAASQSKNSLITFWINVHNNVVFPTFSGPKDKYCLSVGGLLQTYLVAVGKAVASAYAATAADVQVSGSGSACAFSQAAAAAEAEAFAGILGEAIVSANIGYNTAQASAAVKVVNSVLVRAFADSYSQACAKDGGSASAFQTTFANAISYPIASACIYLFAKVDCTGVNSFANSIVQASSESVSQATVETDSGASSTGTGSASSGGSGVAFATEKCKGKYSVCCSSKFSAVCNCGAGCTAFNRGGSPVIYQDAFNGFSCNC